MYDLLLQTSFFLSLGAIIYLLSRAIPRVTETGEVKHAQSRFDRFLMRLPLNKIDGRLNLFFEKILRRMRVSILKLDNLVNQYLNKFKRNSNKNETRERSNDLFEKINNGRKE